MRAQRRVRVTRILEALFWSCRSLHQPKSSSTKVSSAAPPHRRRGFPRRSSSRLRNKGSLKVPVRSRVKIPELSTCSRNADAKVKLLNAAARKQSSKFQFRRNLGRAVWHPQRKLRKSVLQEEVIKFDIILFCLSMKKELQSFVISLKLLLTSIQSSSIAAMLTNLQLKILSL